jgi:hypothetical protein
MTNAATELAALRALVTAWAQNQLPPHNAGPVELRAWLDRCKELHNRLLRAGGVTPLDEEIEQEVMDL